MSGKVCEDTRLQALFVLGESAALPFAGRDCHTPAVRFWLRVWPAAVFARVHSHADIERHAQQHEVHKGRNVIRANDGHAILLYRNAGGSKFKVPRPLQRKGRLCVLRLGLPDRHVQACWPGCATGGFPPALHLWSIGLRWRVAGAVRPDNEEVPDRRGQNTASKCKRCCRVCSGC